MQYVVQSAQDALARVYSQKEGRANEVACSPVQFQLISFCAITLQYCVYFRALFRGRLQVAHVKNYGSILYRSACTIYDV
jgi:hypothetical protein